MLRSLLLTCCLLNTTYSATADSKFTGTLKSFALVQDEVNSNFFTARKTYQLQSSVRLMWEKFNTNTSAGRTSAGRTLWQIHYELSPVLLSRQQPLDSPTFAILGDSYRLKDLRGSLSGKTSKNQVYQNLDRFNVQWQFPQGDLTVGRQAISFGSARIINPTDIFLPFNVQTFNQEYRTGVDAIRYQAPLGELGEIDMGLVLGEDGKPESSAIFLQLRGNVDGKDLQFAVTRFAEQTLVGAGIQAALGNYGFWFELASVKGETDYVRASVGLDYAFTENSFAMIEFHHNGAGAAEPDEYLSLLTTLRYQRGGVFLLGQNYLIPSVSVQLSPLWGVRVQAIYNLTDDSAFFSLSAEYNVAENFYIDFGIYHFFGDEITGLAQGRPLLRSEYGTSPDVMYSSLRFYF